MFLLSAVAFPFFNQKWQELQQCLHQGYGKIHGAFENHLFINIFDENHTIQKEIFDYLLNKRDNK